jgi:4'-phosphopantetheinyl transferase
MVASHGELLRTLNPGQVDLWTVSTGYSADSTPVCLQSVLSNDEQKEARRFHQAKHQRQFVVARALLRRTLSRYFRVPAGDWRFARGLYNKPFLAGPYISPSPQFSLSHTDGLIACLITLSPEAAVDVEKVEYNDDLPLVARQVLSATELKTLSTLSRKEWTALFFEYWTLKEAYAKARGLGLGIKLSDITIERGLDNAIRAHFAPSVGDDSSTWAFWRRRLPSKHTLSVAAKQDFPGELRIVRRSVKFEGMRMTETMAHDEQRSD